MNRRPLLAAVVGLSIFCPAIWADPPDESQPEGTSAEASRLQGTWRVVSLTRDGKKAEPTDIDNIRLIISENQYTYKNQQGERKVGTFKIGSQKKPRVLQTTYAEQPNEGKTVNRIFEWVDKQTLKMCEPGPNERVADNFEAPLGSGRQVTVWHKIDE